MTPPLLKPVGNKISRPTVSVVMPTYNRAEILSETAKLILNQTLVDIELIISDDHSEDQTPFVVDMLMKSDTRVSYHKPDKKGGINRVLNEGIGLSKGYYVQICHDHDIYFPELTEKLASVLRIHPSVVFVHPGRQGCDHLGNPIKKAYFVCDYPEVTKGRAWKIKMLKKIASPVTGLSMIRRSALEEVGLFDANFGPVSDIDMWMRLCDIGDVGYVKELLLYVRGRDPNHPFSGFNWDLLEQNIRIHRKHIKSTFKNDKYYWWKMRSEIQFDYYQSYDYLNCLRHKNKEQINSGKAYLRKKGVFLSRIIASII